MKRFPTSRRARIGLLAAIGAVFGFGFGYVFGHASRDIGVTLGALEGVILAAGAVAAAVLSVAPRRLARTLEPDADDVASTSELRSMRGQALILALGAVLLTLPLVAGPLARSSTTAGVLWWCAFAALLLWQMQRNWTLYRSADEFLQRAILITAAMTFWIGQTALFFYAAAEQFGLVPRIAAWDLGIILIGLYIIVAAAVSSRTHPT